MRVLEDTATGWMVRVNIHPGQFRLNQLTLHLAEGLGAGREATFDIQRDVWPEVVELIESCKGWTIGPKVTVGLQRVAIDNSNWEIYHLVQRTWE